MDETSRTFTIERVERNETKGGTEFYHVTALSVDGVIIRFSLPIRRDFGSMVEKRFYESLMEKSE